MKTVIINRGEERKEDLKGMKCFWLTNLTKEVKGEDVLPEVKQYNKPTYPSPFEPSEKIMVRHNYDGMLAIVVWDPETKTLTGKGEGWTTLTYTFE